MLTKNGWTGKINYKENESKEKVLISEEKEIFCTGCGKKISFSNKFCSFCGKEN